MCIRDRDPDGRVFAPLADAYRRAGDLDRADELLREGLASRSDFVPGHVVSGWVRRDQGDVAGAALAFRAALALDAQNTEALAGLAELDEGHRRETPLATECKGPVTRTLAELYAGQGLYGHALGVYRRLLERDPDDAALRNRMSELQSLSAKSAAAGPDREEVQTPEREGAEGPGESGESSTPVDRTPPSASGPGRSAGPSARQYLQGLLSWASGEPAPPAPISGAQSPVEAEARVESEAPAAAGNGLSAKGSPGEAPAQAAPAAAFASAPVPIASLAPEAADVAAPAPDPSRAADGQILDGRRPRR